MLCRPNIIFIAQSGMANESYTLLFKPNSISCTPNNLSPASSIMAPAPTAVCSWLNDMLFGPNIITNAYSSLLSAPYTMTPPPYDLLIWSCKLWIRSYILTSASTDLQMLTLRQPWLSIDHCSFEKYFSSLKHTLP